MIVGLIVVGIGAGFVGGYYAKGFRTQATGNRTQEKTQVLVAPSPTPDASKFDNTKVTVKSFDGKKLVYTLEDKTEKSILDVSKIKIWQKPTTSGGKAVETTWSVVKVGTKLTITSDKATGQIMGVLVL